MFYENNITSLSYVILYSFLMTNSTRMESFSLLSWELLALYYCGQNIPPGTLVYFMINVTICTVLGPITRKLHWQNTLYSPWNFLSAPINYVSSDLTFAKCHVVPSNCHLFCQVLLFSTINMFDRFAPILLFRTIQLLHLTDLLPCTYYLAQFRFAESEKSPWLRVLF